MVRGVEEPGWLADLIAFSPEFTPPSARRSARDSRSGRAPARAQRDDPEAADVLNLRQQIAAEAQAGMDKQQREYFLREQIRAIQKELGEGTAEETLAKELRAARSKPPACRRRSRPRRCPGRAAGAAASVLARDRRHPHLPRVADRAALGDRDRGPARSRPKPRAILERRPLRAREGQGAHPRVHRRAQAGRRQAAGADPLLRRPSGRRQDQPRPLDRPRDRPQLRAHVARRRARRGRDSRPPAHLCRRDAGPGHQGAARREEPATR